ncbi:hypothetical protein AAHH86_00205 [Candidatus Hodgkinia cicadicola]
MNTSLADYSASAEAKNLNSVSSWGLASARALNLASDCVSFLALVELARLVWTPPTC